MTDQISRQLLTASFKGVEFGIRSEGITEAGRKLILHEYPNSAERFIEDIGQVPPRFRVEAFVHGSDWLEQTNALRAALDEEGAGPLVMPVFGTVQAFALSYSVDASQTEVGESRFHLEFAVSRRTPGPIISPPDIEDVFELSDDARGVVERILDVLWQIPEGIFDSLVSQHDIQQLSLVLGQVTTGLVVVEDGARYADKLNLLSRDKASLVRDGASLAGNLVQGDVTDPGAWQQLSLSIDDRDPEGTFDAAQRLLSFGSDLSKQVGDFFGGDGLTGSETLPISPIQTGIPLWPADTGSRVRRNANRNRFVQANRVSALIFFYERAAAADYQTEEQINEVRERLAQGFDAVMRTGFDDATSVQSQPTVRESVDRVRFATLQILDLKQQVTPGVSTVTVLGEESFVTLSHALYAEGLTNPEELETRMAVVRELNPAQPPTSVTGDVEILERAD